MTRQFEGRLQKLEKGKPTDLQSLSDEELDARIEHCLSVLMESYATIEELAESYRADGNEPGAQLVLQHLRQKEAA